MPPQPSKLNVLHGQFERACARLSEVLAMPMDEHFLVRDSAIQRFEFTFELFWKTIKAWAARRMDAVHTANDAIEYAAMRKLISEDEEEYGRRLIRWRNMTSHIYEENMAGEIFGQITGAASFMRDVIERLVRSESVT